MLDDKLTIVVGYPPGGTTDRIARLVGEKLRTRLGVDVIVDNRAGAGGRIAAQQVKRTPASQNVLLLGNPATMVIAPLVFKDVGYDPDRDFWPVSNVGDYQFAVAVAREVPVRELAHLVAWLRANPEKANFGVPASGSLPHFFGLMLGDAVHVRSEIISYRGSAPLQTDLIGGQLPVAIDTLDSVYPQHEGGKLRILAMSGTRRAAFAKDIPTFKEAGFDVAATGWNAFFAPRTMPDAKVQLLGRAIREVMLDPAMRASFEAMKLTPVASTPAETDRMIKTFRGQWEPVVKRAGFTP
ncbi:Bug family tripartite tricarboxylate transporter substrate binding protein [Variovorax fucosicus]|uniref:Bug family tripartite tricarboxylate transporter substrate binding protein n=1 Tax=Variovorax fucosicus TaxID=3053517 RepID=UPI0025787C40|nr:Bug family tripartite tricarboxylate transporter substrate binding protein [Variovorax sp. J22G47]MDM0055945.1 Bug family tripartite tricarboxylate transporter substrate binding protein [Variovorax sp. J22G47]